MRIGTYPRWPLVLGVAGVVALAGCGVGGGNKSSGTSANAKQTIVFATQGLGAEGDASKAAVAGFEKAHPKITVKILTLSPVSNNAYQQLQQRFVAKSGTPDVITSDVIWPATFAKAGWLAPLDSFHPDTSRFFSGQVQSVRYKGKTYGVPWFINAEGVYYRTDLVPSPPKTPQQLVSDAKAAMKKDPSLKEGLAFEGDKYEGAVTALVNFLGAYGGRLDPANLDSPQNVQGLQFMRDTIYKYGIAPKAVTGWQESQVQSAWLSGQTPFAMNWPYIFSLSEAKGSKVKGRTGWIPFPAGSNTPQAALGGDDLVVNANSTHKAAAWEFIQYLSSPKVQIERAVAAGDPPAVTAAYTSALYARAPYFKQEKAVFQDASPRPVNPAYPKISDQLQTMLSSVLTGQEQAKAALARTGPQVKSLASGG
ncbi:MAG TPA: ABC transporter substrate-binding protein [Streptosporangiales bacterium]